MMTNKVTVSAQAAPVSVPIVEREQLSTDERRRLMAEAVEWLERRDAKLVAHYYTSSDLQILADETGGCVSDSLDMARFGTTSPARVLVVGGVRFMGETAKILNPEKQVLMPNLNANCSLDIGCPADEFEKFCAAHPDRQVLVYANTSARVKALSDWVVTSGSAVDVVRHLHEQGEKILWAPDKYLGDYVRHRTGADMVLWGGACVVHEEFKGQELEQLRADTPQACVLAHPESPASVLRQADYIGSTTELIHAVRRMEADTFIVATDQGILHKMRQAAPGKIFLAAPTSGHGATCQSCAYCPWMAMNSLRSLIEVLKNNRNEIHVSEEVAASARRPIQRLLDFAAIREQVVYGTGDA